MLLPDNIHPENCIYYNGSFILKELQSNRKQSLLDLYQNVKAKRGLSFSVFILCLDWLYLLDSVKTDNSGVVQLCI